MKNIILLLFVIFSSCSQKIDVSKIDFINGYWQIQKVEDANGNEKEYKINEFYDYFEVKKNIGFHKKVQWQPTNKFLVNDAQDNLKIIPKDDKVFLEFYSQFGKHKDELILLSKNEMILESKEKVKFYYDKVIINTNK
ncbi:hypothetical protein [Flavobacterium sp.]|uniref:hypothetical protein n=1 Tax=Flavobacterium sp. TaxID=239 RepID=UPI00286CD0EB|nr:hypothetical protein [Flavobacterium sp.]